jgi:hypothetical protein
MRMNHKTKYHNIEKVKNWILKGISNNSFWNDDPPAKARQAGEVAGKKTKSATETGFLEMP